MTDVVVVDTNLVMLLAVGSPSNAYIEKHKRLSEFLSIDDFELLVKLIGPFSDMVILPYSCGSV